MDHDRHSKSRIVRRAIAAALAVVTVSLPLTVRTASAVTVPSPTSTVAAGSPAVSYLGWTGRVPAGWAVVDLTAHPATCVRFDVHAVYLGRPGDQQSCPNHLAGRTEALLVEPLNDAGPRSDLTSPTTAVTSLPAAVDAVQEAHVSIPSAGIRMTATWGAQRPTVDRLLSSATTTRGWRAISPKSRALSEPNTTATQQRAVALATTQFKGEAFDACTAPSLRTMTAWLASPYRAVGVYIGGANRGCAQANLSASWVAAVTSMGWHLIPIYVGRQAPYPLCGCLPIDPGQAAAQGRLDAADAVTDARALGIGPGATLFNDMEGYTRGATNTTAVLTFLSTWTAQLHAFGYRSAVYSGSTSGIRDLVAVTPSSPVGNPLPDVIWYARWDGRDQVTGDVSIPADRWTHERVHQYANGSQTWGGVTIDIDRNAVDAHLAGPVVAPTPPVVPLEVARAFVQRSYSVILGRQPSPSYLLAWTERISSGASRGDFLKYLLASDEWASRMVTAEYLIVLHRMPDPGGRAHWTSWLRSRGQPAQLAANLAATNERWRLSRSDPATFVRDLYRDIVKLTPDPARQSYWTKRLQAGASRYDVALAFTTGGTQVSRFVTSVFQGMLGRTPDSSGLAYWSDVYGRSFNQAAVVVPVGASIEAVRLR